MKRYKDYLAFCNHYELKPISLREFIWRERVKPVIDYAIDAIKMPFRILKGRNEFNHALISAGMEPLSLYQYVRITCAPFGSKE